MKFSGKVGNGPMNKWLNFSSDPDHRLDTGIVFRIRNYWEIWKVVSIDCAARLCSAASHALADIAIATMTSLRHRPTTDIGTDIATLVRRALAEVYTVPVHLARTKIGFCFNGMHFRILIIPCARAKFNTMLYYLFTINTKILFISITVSRVNVNVRYNQEAQLLQRNRSALSVIYEKITAKLCWLIS